VEVSWPDWLLVATGLLYVGAACGFALTGKHGLAVAFAGYAFANIGLIWASVGG
jgi:hypothetical protein